MYATPPMVSSAEVTSRILTAIHKNSKRLSHRRGTEFKEIGLFVNQNLLSLRSQCLRGGRTGRIHVFCVRHKRPILPNVLCASPLRRRSCKTRERGKPSLASRPLPFQ